METDKYGTQNLQRTHRKVTRHGDFIRIYFYVRNEGRPMLILSVCCFVIYRAFHDVLRDYIYDKKTKGPTFMEFFTATEKLNKFFFFATRDVRCVHHG